MIRAVESTRMGMIDELLRVRGNEACDETLLQIERAWATRDLNLRAAVLGKLGAVKGGFRLTPNSDWRTVRSGIRLTLRTMSGLRLCQLWQRLFTTIDETQTDAYYVELGLDPQRVADGDSPAPTAEAFLQCWERSDAARRIEFLRWTATIAAVGFPSWREAAERAGHAMLHPPSTGTPISQEAVSPVAIAGVPVAEHLKLVEVLPAPEAVEVEPDVRAAETTPADVQPFQAIPEQLTPLDHVIIDQIIEAADRQTGARELSTVRELVEEFARINSKRVQSRFHRGFLAALAGEGLPDPTGGENQRRRAWLLAGWLMGHLRRTRESAHDAFLQLGSSDRRTLLEEPLAARYLGDAYIDLLADARVPEHVAIWLDHATPNGVRIAVRLVRTLIAMERIDAATSLATSIEQSLLRRFGRDWLKAAGSCECLIAHATGLRGRGQFDEAEVLLQEAERSLDIESDAFGALPHEQKAAFVGNHSQIAAQRILTKLGVKKLEELWFPQQDSDRTAAELLEAAAPLLGNFRETFATSATLPSMAYCIGLDAVYGTLRGGRTTNLNEITEYIAQALHRLEVEPDEASMTRLLPRIRVLRAILAARQGDSEVVRAITEIVNFESVHGTLPMWVVRDVITLGLANQIAAVSELVRPRLASDLQGLMQDDLLSEIVRVPAVRSELWNNYLRYCERLSMDERINVVLAILASAVETAAPASEIQAIVDRLIGYANRISECAPRILETLRRGKFWARIWQDEEDFIAVESELARWSQAEADLMEARARCLRRARALMTDNSDDCLEYLDLAESLGEPSESTEPVRRTFQERRRRAIATAGTDGDQRHRRVRVLFVGGDERQRKVQSDVLQRIRREDPEVAVDFVYPGWGSNWNASFEEARRHLASADIVVLMRFTPTIFGERMREAINGANLQWRPTVGHAAPAMARAILQAAEVARRS